MLQKLRRFRGQKGFTLIELLAVVAIIAVLAALAVPKVYQAITSSKAKSARADVTTIAAALDQYAMENNNTYPTTLNDLVLKKYMKQTTNFLNGFGKRYFYAVNDVSNPTAYILADPGQHPDNQVSGGAPVYRLYRCQYDTATGTAANPSCGLPSGQPHSAPEGTASTATAVSFTAITFIDNAQAPNLQLMGATAPDPSTWFNTFRTDIVTQ